MKGSIHKPGCICKKEDPKKKCTCGTKWAYTVDIGIDPKTGKRKQKKKGGFDRKSDAETALNQLLSEIENGTYIKESDILFKDFTVEWLTIYEQTHNVKISTVRVRQNEIDNLMPYFAHYKIRDITKRQYQNALTSLKAKGLADNTLEGIHTTGRMIFKKAAEYDLIKTDPTEFAKIPKTQKTIEELEHEQELPKYLEKEELALFLETAKNKGFPLDYEVFLTLSYTGMRAGELCALKDTDIDSDNSLISITKTYYNPTNNTLKYTLLPPKTKKSKREIDVDSIVISVLQKHLSKQKVLKMRLRDTYYDKGFIFVNTTKHPGYPIYIKLIESRMCRLLKLAGLNNNLTPHSLRHTHASLMAEAGASLPEIMDRLGHSDDETTTQIYLHVTQAKKKETSQKFSELMRSLK